jgi:UDP-glucose 4-epimerase
MATHKFVKAIFKAEEITVFGDGTQTRDFTFVDDAVEATMLAANNDVVGEVFNVGGGTRISVNELIEEIEKLIGKKAKTKYIEKQEGDVRNTLADVTKAREILNWNPKIDIYYGLKEYIRWYTDEHEQGKYA